MTDILNKLQKRIEAETLPDLLGEAVNTIERLQAEIEELKNREPKFDIIKALNRLSDELHYLQDYEDISEITVSKQKGTHGDVLQFRFRILPTNGDVLTSQVQMSQFLMERANSQHMSEMLTDNAINMLKRHLRTKIHNDIFRFSNNRCGIVQW